MIVDRRQRLLWAIGMLGLAAAAGIFVFRNLNAEETSNAVQPALPGFAMRAADITEYAITTPNGAYRLSKGDSRWVIIERGGFPASSQQIQDLAAGLANLRLERKLTADPKKFAALRLTDPRQRGTGILIQAMDAQGLERAALLTAPYDGELAVRFPGDNVAYVAKALLPRLENPAAFADFRVLSVPPERVQSVELIYAAGGAVTLLRAKSNASFAPNSRQAPLPYDALALATTPLTPFDVKEAPFDVQPGNLGERRITTFDGLVISMHFDKRDDAIWTSIAAGGGGSTSEALAINSHTSGWQFALPVKDEMSLFPASLDATAKPSAPQTLRTVQTDAAIEAEDVSAE
jgi:hypothetical protein